MTPSAVAVFGSSLTAEGTPEWESAVMVGAILAVAGHSVITGGYGGTMQAVSAGAARKGGHVVGVVAPTLFPGRHEANPFVTELVEAATLPERIGTMMSRAHGVIALPGSIGTAAELLIAWNGNHIGRRNGGLRLPVIAVGPDWARLAALLLANPEADPTDIELAADAVSAAERMIQRLTVL